MDLPTLRGLATLVLMIAFIGIVIWAWSGKRKSQFQAAANLPLEEDNDGHQAGTAGDKKS